MVAKQSPGRPLKRLEAGLPGEGMAGDRSLAKELDSKLEFMDGATKTTLTLGGTSRIPAFKNLNLNLPQEFDCHRFAQWIRDGLHET